MVNETGKLNIGVVGAGWWATSAHIPGILRHGSAHLRAIQNRTQEKADRIARDFGADLAFVDYEELILTAGVDAVVVSSTPNMHYQQAKFALEHGKHVLIEKPVTFTAAEAQDLCRIAAKNNLQIVVSCPWHYTRHGIEAKRLIGAGALGDVKMISILMTNPVDKLLKGINTTPTHGLNGVYIEPNPGSYSDPAIAGGGQIYGQVSHVGAYLSFLMGTGAKEVFAKFDFDNCENDIYDVLLITMNNGTLVTLASTGATPMTTRNYEVRIYGSKAVLFLELWKGNMELYPFDDSPDKYPVLTTDEIYPDRAPVLNFIDVCLGKAENISPGKLGVNAMEIIEAAGISNKSGEPVKIENLWSVSKIKLPS